MNWLDDFFIRALVAGIGVAVIAGPFGCMVVWRRLAYFGDTLAHAALLGIALALALEIDTAIGVFVSAAGIAMLLLVLRQRTAVSSDAILGILSHASLAIGLVVLSLMTWVRFDLSGFLFGDILAVSIGDIATIYLGGGAVVATFLFFWRPLLAGTVSLDLAEAEATRPERANIAFTVLLAVFIALAIKLVGVLLITALLIIPAATARGFASSPEQMAAIAALLGVLAVVGGLYASLFWDTPTGPSIVSTAFGIFVASTLILRLVRKDALDDKR